MRRKLPFMIAMILYTMVLYANSSVADHPSPLTETPGNVFCSADGHTFTRLYSENHDETISWKPIGGATGYYYVILFAEKSPGQEGWSEYWLTDISKKHEGIVDETQRALAVVGEYDIALWFATPENQITLTPEERSIPDGHYANYMDHYVFYVTDGSTPAAVVTPEPPLAADVFSTQIDALPENAVAASYEFRPTFHHNLGSNGSRYVWDEIPGADKYYFGLAYQFYADDNSVDYALEDQHTIFWFETETNYADVDTSVSTAEAYRRMPEDMRHITEVHFLYFSDKVVSFEPKE